MKRKTKITHIPNEIVVEEILQRLPVRSLLRFRCVSKSWCASISHPNFSLKTATERVAVGCGLLTSDKIYIVDQNSSVQDVLSVRLAKDGRYDPLKVRLLSSYGGLLLLLHKNNNDIYLFNPSTRDVKLVSNFPHDRLVYSGLCRDPVTKTYKVLIVDGRCVIRMFSLSSQIWKVIEPVTIPCCDYPVNVREILYFLVAGKRGIFFVLYFDPMNDKLLEMWIPQPVQRRVPCIGKLGGCLALTTGDEGDNTEVWVMKEHGVKESWTCLFRISKTCLLGRLRPLLHTNDGEVLFQVNGERLVTYNVKEQSSKDVLLPPQIAYGRDWLQIAFPYVPSLIPPP